MDGRWMDFIVRACERERKEVKGKRRKEGSFSFLFSLESPLRWR